MANITLDSVSLIDGTKEGFNVEDLDKKNTMYFVRTSAESEDGYIRFNGKDYGTAKDIDCGEY